MITTTKKYFHHPVAYEGDSIEKSPSTTNTRMPVSFPKALIYFIANIRCTGNAAA